VTRSRAVPRRAAPLVLAALLLAGPAAGSPAERLAEAIRFRTITYQDPADLDAEAFLGFHRFLERRFPRVHAALRRNVVGEYSLLYEWTGAEPDLLPVLLTAHFDVVPVPAGQLDAWEQPPFEGVIADGAVWGRGALDDKIGVMAMLEAVDGLVAAGFTPRRTVYLAFGHDEERGGEAGAGATAAWLEERGVRLRFTLDEGMAITVDAVPGVEEPVALIGVAEKGYLTVRLRAEAPGGHSSTPPPESAIGRLSRAVLRLEESPMPARMDGVVGSLLDATAPHMPWLSRLALQNRWLTSSLVESRLATHPATDAMIRTTTAVTMIEAGVKENVLPPVATATVNFRIAPHDTADAVVAHVGRVVDDPEIGIEITRATPPSPVADVDSPDYALLVEALHELDPGLVVAPGLVLGGTDTKHYVRLAEQSFRFTPMRLGPGDLPRIHGTNERISVANLEEAIRFYGLLLRRLDGLEGP
jgi:carboxypeptidase PM20D1